MRTILIFALFIAHTPTFAAEPTPNPETPAPPTPAPPTLAPPTPTPPTQVPTTPEPTALCPNNDECSRAGGYCEEFELECPQGQISVESLCAPFEGFNSSLHQRRDCHCCIPCGELRCDEGFDNCTSTGESRCDPELWRCLVNNTLTQITCDDDLDCACICKAPNGTDLEDCPCHVRVPTPQPSPAPSAEPSAEPTPSPPEKCPTENKCAELKGARCISSDDSCGVGFRESLSLCKPNTYVFPSLRDNDCKCCIPCTALRCPEAEYGNCTAGALCGNDNHCELNTTAGILSTDETCREDEDCACICVAPPNSTLNDCQCAFPLKTFEPSPEPSPAPTPEPTAACPPSPDCTERGGICADFAADDQCPSGMTHFTTIADQLCDDTSTQSECQCLCCLPCEQLECPLGSAFECREFGECVLDPSNRT